MVSALELRRRRVPAPMHVHPARRPLGNEAGAREAAVPPTMRELPGRLVLMPAPRHVRIPNSLRPDGEDFFRFREIDSHPARVLPIEEPVVGLPLRL